MAYHNAQNTESAARKRTGRCDQVRRNIGIVSRREAEARGYFVKAREDPRSTEEGEHMRAQM